jgi:murein DD-endopeptidase MepM/ murein hydrolase activator NlpD
MKNIILISLFLSSCASKLAPKDSAPEIQNSASVIEPISIKTQPGKVRWVTFPMAKGWENSKLKCRDQMIKHNKLQDGLHYAYIAETYFSDLKPHQCELILNDKKMEIVAFNVSPYVYKAEQLKVDYRKISLSKKDQKRAQAEQIILNKLYGQSASTPYFKAPFRAPLNSYITSVYGIRRVYNKAHRGQHLGTDFRAAIGVPVPATNRGKVMFAGDLFYTGGTVIIDHGLDIFSVYGHLSEWKTKAGTIVNAGDIIGLTGNTGRTSGPHLHWGVKVHGHYIDGYSLIEESKKHFK